MKKFSKSAFVALLALVCYAGFVSAQVVTFDNSGDFSSLVGELKAGNHPGFGGGHGNQNPHPSPVQPPHTGGFGQPNHGNNNPGHNNPGHDNPGHNNPGHDNPGHNNPGHNDPWPNNPGHNDPWPNNPGHNDPGHNNPGPWHPGPQPQPWHPGPQPEPWHPGPQPGPHNDWHPHHPGHPDWNNNDWGHNGWNNHGQNNNGWWGNYDWWWMNNTHPYSQYRTVCDVTPGVSAKGYIVENSMPFYGKATFYYYDIFNNLIAASNASNSVYSGGNGSPIFDFYQVPNRADRCFLAVTRN